LWVPTEGGVIDGHYYLILHQIADMTATFTWSAFVSFLILFVMSKTTMLKLRMDDAEIEKGMDLSEMGISCYEFIDEVII
jgi:Amt family ammonium transporter